MWRVRAQHHATPPHSILQFIQLNTTLLVRSKEALDNPELSLVWYLLGTGGCMAGTSTGLHDQEGLDEGWVGWLWGVLAL